MAVKQRFRLINGQHHEPKVGFEGHPTDPNRLEHFKAGTTNSIVESERNLVEVFPNKFRVLTEEEEGVPVDQEARRVAVDREIELGHWGEEDRAFLQKLSEENFNRLKNKFTPPKSDSKVTSTLGEDVTSNFQRAYDENFKVFANAKKKFQVTKPDDVNKPLNKEPLDKDGVDKFVDQYLREK